VDEAAEADCTTAINLITMRGRHQSNFHRNFVKATKGTRTNSTTAGPSTGVGNLFMLEGRINLAVIK
jgi:hypothetical protein